MLSGSTRVTLDALHCSACPHEFRSGLFGVKGLIGPLRDSSGGCPACGGKSFDALFTVTRESRDYRAAAKAVKYGCMFGPFGFLIARFLVDPGESGKSSQSYELKDVEGAVILSKMEGSIEERIAWIVRI